MSHDPNHIRAAQRRLQEARELRAFRRGEYEARCRRDIPELEELDRRIRNTVTQAIAAALRQGEDPGPAVEAARQSNLALQARRLELLRAHGVDPGELEETPLCPLCRDTGRRGRELCQCVTRLCVEENLRELGQQMDLEQARFERFSLEWYSPRFDPQAGASPRECMETVRDLCRDYAAAFPAHPFKNLLLSGGTGLGKTFLSGCIAREVAQGGYWVVYASAGALFRQYETVKFSREAEEAEGAVERYESCDLLVLDDLGSEMTTAFVQSALYQLLNARLNGGRHTVISSNLDLEGARQRYTSQVVSRLEGEYRWLPFLGEDIRVQRKGG